MCPHCSHNNFQCDRAAVLTHHLTTDTMLLSALVILLLRVILRPLPVVGAVNHTDIFVDPISGTTDERCWTDGEKLPCSTLDLALQGAENAFDNVSVLLKPGVYNLTNAYNFNEKKGFNLVVREDNNLVSATIICTCDGAGLAFFSSSNITLESVKILGCGAVRNSTSRDLNSKSKSAFLEFQVALYFLFCSDVIMNNVSVSHSNGTGLVLYSTVGQNRFLGCTFGGNAPWNESAGGGGVPYLFD